MIEVPWIIIFSLYASEVSFGGLLYLHTVDSCGTSSSPNPFEQRTSRAIVHLQSLASSV